MQKTPTLTKDAENPLGIMLLATIAFAVVYSAGDPEGLVLAMNGLPRRSDTLLLPILFISLGWIIPIVSSVHAAKRKGYSTAYAFLGIYPFAGWLVLVTLYFLRKRTQCVNCGGFFGSNFRYCPYCGCPVHEDLSP